MQISVSKSPPHANKAILPKTTTNSNNNAIMGKLKDALVNQYDQKLQQKNKWTVNRKRKVRLPDSAIMT